VRIHYTWSADAFLFRAALVVGLPVGAPEEELARAVELARTSDVAVVVVGTSEDVESEGHDRTSLTLPGRQDELVRAVAAVNPRTVVVVNAGAPVELPWRDEVSAVLVSWFPGMEFGNALADVLLGDVEPGGRLPATWPTALTDAPVHRVTPTDGRLEYTEGLDIGHRAYLAAGIEPAYWFGHGLGYTTWEFESIAADVSGDGLTATVRVRNTGGRRGKQVVQVYAARPDSAVERPARWLAGFAVVTADPGETVEVPVDVHGRTLRHWEVGRGWVVEAGDVVLSVGASAGDLRASVAVALRNA
jgi:beta-glucosidase